MLTPPFSPLLMGPLLWPRLAQALLGGLVSCAV
jgi:hypothetical protein